MSNMILLLMLLGLTELQATLVKDSVIDDSDWFDNDIWDVINLNFDVQTHQKCMKANDGYICVCRNVEVKEMVLCDYEDFEARQVDDGYQYYQYQYFYEVPEDMLIPNGAAYAAITALNGGTDYRPMFPVPDHAAANAAVMAAAVAAAVPLPVGGPQTNAANRAAADAIVANPAGVADAVAAAVAGGAIVVPAFVTAGVNAAIADVIAGGGVGHARNEAADAAGIPRSYSKHHIITKSKLKSFWNDLVRNNDFISSGLAGFLDTIVTAFNVPPVHPAGNLPAPIVNKPGQIAVFVGNPHNPDPLAGGAVASAQLQRLQKFYIWMPWNIHVGPVSDLRYDDAGDAFEEKANRIAGIDATRYNALKEAYNKMYEYHWSNQPQDAQDAIMRLKEAAICDHTNRCAAIGRRRFGRSPDRAECEAAGCCWNTARWRGMQYQCSQPMAAARTAVGFTIANWRQARDGTWEIRPN
eukprot:265881_1